MVECFCCSPIANNAIQGLSAAIFVIGLFLHRRSEVQAGATKQKYKRINSAGGAWSLIRYPNYLGQILMYWSWVLPAGKFYIFIYLVLKKNILLLQFTFSSLHRWIIGPSHLLCPFHFDLLHDSED